MTAQLSDGAPQLSAASLSAATTNDPQFQVPSHPSVVAGAVLLWVGDQLLIEGTGSRRVLSGRSARRILPDLLPLLDGTRGLPELAEALALQESRVQAVLLLLYSCGLLQQGPVTVGPRSPQTVLLSRLLDTTRANINVAQAEQRLADALVQISGPDGVRAVLAAELTDLGLAVSVPGHETAQRPGTLAVVWVDDQHRPEAARSAGRCRARGVPVLLMGAGGDELVLGPYSAVDYGACVDCYLAQTPISRTGPVTADVVATAAALTAIEIVALIARVGTPLSLRGRARVDLLAGRTGNTYLAPRPGCRTCGDPSVAVQDPPIAYQYETSVAFPPRRLVNPRDHQHHFEAANVALQFDSKDYPGRSTIDLPGADLTDLTDLTDPSEPSEPGEPGEPSEPGDPGEPSDRAPAGPVVADGRSVTLHQLGGLLAGSCGLKETSPGRAGKLRRWAPTGGNLGSPTAYLLVDDVRGLDPGCYAYVPVGHRLARLGPSPVIPPGERVAPVTIVFTGALLRVAKKYRTFAYRVIHLDTGVALAHLLLLSRLCGVDFANVPHWDDRALLEILGVDRDLEAVTAVVQIGAGTDG